MRAFPNILTVRIIHGKDGVSKGYGFVKFAQYHEMMEFITAFNKSTDFGRALNVTEAQGNRKSIEAFSDAENNVLFIKDIDPEIVTEETLRHYFEKHGNVLRVKIVPGHKDWANIEMEDRFQAESAKSTLNGSRFGGTTKCTIEFGRWVDETAPVQVVKRLTVPVVKTEKSTKKLYPEFFTDEGVDHIIKTMELYSVYQRQTPIAFLDSTVANKSYALNLLHYDSSLFDWQETTDVIIPKEDPFI